MFSRARALGHALDVEPVPVGDELPVHDRQPVADVRPGVLARDRVHGVRPQRVLDRRAGGAVAQRLVDPGRMQREALADAAVVDGDAGVLADEVPLGVGDADVPVDRLEHALARHRRLAVARLGERVAQVLRDVLQRPDVEVGGGLLDRVLQVARRNGRGAHLALILSRSRRQPGRRAGRRRRIRAGCCPSSGCARACRRRSRRRRRGPRASSRRRVSITSPPFW